MSHKFKTLLHKYHIQHRITSPHHPHANGQVESTNKFIEAILTKTIRIHPRYWANMILEALWAYLTIWCNTTGFSPYDLVYCKSFVLSIEFKIKILKTSMDVKLDVTKSQRSRLNQLNELDEKCIAAVDQTTLIQQQ